MKKLLMLSLFLFLFAFSSNISNRFRFDSRKPGGRFNSRPPSRGRICLQSFPARCFPPNRIDR
ncbi:hypothetical protein A3C98_05425 [Candidatus Roizmanbacteria bacterium RIFCSPHIGHO2_02_FULL_37_15]|nr:MAG: hypothetical protein A3C98_05425 [Candidatus Roizmanbacteria bacterium RIFCSPHIGHO2_02_FULL_37_15]